MPRMKPPAPNVVQFSPLSELCNPPAPPLALPAKILVVSWGWKATVRMFAAGNGLVQVFPPSVLLKMPWLFVPAKIIDEFVGLIAMAVTLLVANPTRLQFFPPLTLLSNPAEVPTYSLPLADVIAFIVTSPFRGADDC